MSALDELVARVSGLAEGLTGNDRDVMGAELYEVERSLRAAQRRLTAMSPGR